MGTRRCYRLSGDETLGAPSIECFLLDGWDTTKAYRRPSGFCLFQLCFFLALAFALAIQALPQATQQPKAHYTDAAKLADIAFRAGYAARQSGDLETARARFAEVVRLEPQIAEGHEALGTVLLEIGQPAPAIVELEAAAKLKPTDPGIETNLAQALVQNREPSKAVAHFQTALKQSQTPGQTPLNAAFFDSYARALAADGKQAEAIDQFTQEEQLTGPQADIADSIGTLYAQLGKWDQAQHAFERAIANNGSFVRARIHLGILLRQQHSTAASLSTLEDAERIEPPNAEAVLEHGRTLAAINQDEAALADFDRSMKLDPNLPGAPVDMAMSLQRMGRQEEAIPWFEKALDKDPRNTNVLVNLGLALTLTGKAQQALSIIARAQAEQPNDPTVYKNRGVAHIQLSAFDDAITDFKAAMALDPDDPQLHYDLGLAYKFKDRVDDAVAELRKAAAMDPTLEDPPYTLGILYMQTGKLDDAVTELKKAVAMRPDNGNAWAILGSTLKQNSKLDEARDALEKAVPLLPGQPGPLVTLAGVLAEEAAELSTQADSADTAGDTAKAAQIRAQVKDLRAQAAEDRRKSADLSRAAVNRQRAAFAMNAGNQLLLRGQIADAVSRYQESIAADATFPDPHVQLALAYDRQGRAQDAAAERAKAAELSTEK